MRTTVVGDCNLEGDDIALGWSVIAAGKCLNGHKISGVLENDRDFFLKIIAYS